MNFVIFNADGEILRTVSCPEEAAHLQVADGERIVEGEADVARDAVDVRSGAVIPGGRRLPPAEPQNYVQMRAAAYPRIEQQLDMLWHAMQAGEIPVASRFFDAISAVKSEFPKTDIGQTRDL